MMSNPALLPNTLEKFLEFTSDREQTIASNMANVDTPGYHTKDVSFQQALWQTGQGSEEARFKPVVSNVHGLLERPDGNNVDLDRESLLLAKTQLQYSMGTQLVKASFHQLLAAINGGN